SQVQSAGSKQLEGMETAKAQALASLDELQANAIPVVQQAGDEAREAIEQAGQTALEHLNESAATMVTQFDQVILRLLRQMQQLDRVNKIDAKKLQAGVQKTAESLQQARMELGKAVSERAIAARTQLGDLESGFTNQTSDLERKVSTTAAQSA